MILRRLYETSATRTSHHSSDKKSDDDISILDIKLDDLETSHEQFPPRDSETIVTGIVSRESLVGEERYDEDYFDDPNLEDDVIRIEDDSPYPEVRCAVSNVDDPEMPVNTLRAWCMGILCATIFPGLNVFMHFRWPSVGIGPLVAILLSYPIGRLWARFVPDKTVLGVRLNPGPFTVKEHVIVTIMASVGGKYSYATDIVAVQRVYYNQQYSFIYQWMLVMSTQLIGFSIGGISRRFLVTPPSMIWPANLVVCALFNTLHSQEYVGIGKRGGWSRERFFIICLAAATAYYFFPGYIFTALSMFTWVCWIAPNNNALKQMFGYSSGMGMSILTFDWAQIAYIGSPLATPWWAAANITTGFVIFYWIITPILYYKNVWHSQFMPIMSRMAFDNTGNFYDVKRILNDDATLNLTEYKTYSPLYLPTAFAISYGLGFASITATLMHTFLYLRKSIMLKFRGGIVERPDIHARLMSHYKQVPDWWYMIMFVITFVFGVISIEVWPTKMPVWALIMALVIGFLYTIPVGIIQAITNQQIGLNVVTELIVGYALPGRPIAMMMFKTWGYIGVYQALKFTSDFKLGHYMKVPPRPMFWCQVVATVIAGTVNLAVQSWMMSNIDKICDPHQVDKFVCPDTSVFFTASVIWGVIGPTNQFSKGQTYYRAYKLRGIFRDGLTKFDFSPALMFFFILGAILPLIVWILMKRFPNSFLRYVNVPLILGGTSLSPPASAVNYVPWAIVAFIFQYMIRRRYFSWWAKYNYVLSAALDSSVAIGSLIIFFCLEYPNNGAIGLNTIQTWWGNTVYKNTADWNMTPVRAVNNGTTFGPEVW